MRKLMMVLAAALAGSVCQAAVRAATPIVWAQGPECWQMKRHAEKLAAVTNGGAAVVFIGDSITHYWEREGQGLWKTHFASGSRRALNLGTGGDRTEHVLWRITAGGELDGYEAKCVSLMIGINNIGGYLYGREPVADTVQGVREILRVIRAKQPRARVILNAILPLPSRIDPSHEFRMNTDTANRELAKLADGKSVIWCDFTGRFIDAQGRQRAEFFVADGVHLNAAGYAVWAETALPLIDRVLGETGMFAVKAGGAAVPLYAARVSKHPINTRWPGHQRTLDQTEISPFALIEAAGAVPVEVTPARAFKEVVVRPLSKGVKPQVADGRITLTLPGAGQYTVELDGTHEALQLFVNAPKDYGIERNAPGVRYFGPGTHDAGLIEVKTGDTVFIDTGAVVYGRIFGKDAHNVRIVGHGILDSSKIKAEIREISKAEEEETKRKHFAVSNAKRHDAMRFYFCDNLEIDGITMVDSPLYTIRPVCCNNLTIRNVKITGNWRYNSDGIDMHNCVKVRISDCYLRTFDDSICVKGFDPWMKPEDMTHNGLTRDVFKDVVVERCVIWNDWGKGLEFGAETQAREICDVTWRDSDIIHADNVALDAWNVDYADIHDVVYDDVRVEMPVPAEARLYQATEDMTYMNRNPNHMPVAVSLGISKHPEYSAKGQPPGKIRNFTFRNIAITAPRKPVFQFFGQDAGHQVENVTFENLTINGTRVETLEALAPTGNQFVRGIVVK